jgi:hypothetical protein
LKNELSVDLSSNEIFKISGEFAALGLITSRMKFFEFEESNQSVNKADCIITLKELRSILYFKPTPMLKIIYNGLGNIDQNGIFKNQSRNK